MSALDTIARVLGLHQAVPPRKLTRDLAIAAIEPPERVRLAVDGLTPSVRVDDVVEVGALVARTPEASRWQKRCHSPLQGVVVGMSEAWIDIEGEPASCAATRHEAVGEQTPESIVTAALEAGVVGLGGAMFPTYVKLRAIEPVDTVLVNGCESEPYFTCDHRVLTESRDEVDCGMALAMTALGAQHGRIIDRESYYPAGYELFLVRDELGREVPSRKLPRDVGALVINVQSARALHRAVCMGEPVIDRVLTVAGGAVARPGNYRVPIGTSVGHILECCGLDESKAAAIITGGPMMGRAAAMDVAITPGTGGVLALSAGEVAERAERPCLRCGRCYEVCPRDLPVAFLVENRTPDVLQCIECGACEYVCPSSIPLVRRLRRAKEEEIRWD